MSEMADAQPPAGAGRRWRFELVVERGKILELARSLGMEDVTAPGGPGEPGRLVAPPTFPVVASLWGGANRGQLLELGFDADRVLHVEEAYRYERGPLREGDRLAGTTTLLGDERRQRRRGRSARVARFRTELRDADSGDLRVTIDRLVMEIEPAAEGEPQ
jgi:hypothetical protein